MLGDVGHREMVEHLGSIASTIRKPSGIVVVSAHWEESEATITAHPEPPIIYDYYGFPPESYSLEYPAPGDPGLAARLSLLSDLEPEKHIRIGEALSNLARDNIMVLGSGFSFHNLKVLLGGDSSGRDLQNEAFESWLIDTCTSSEIDESTRTERLMNWQRAPAARYCHPREEHLLPLHVCYGVAKSACIGHAELTIMGKKSSTYFW